MQNPSVFLVITIVGVLVLQFANLNNAFFWDTVQLGSAHATFFYENGFSSWILPDGIDSGHIPAFGAYLAVLWKIFGRTLLVSHLAMVPFAVGAIYQLYRLCQKFIAPIYVGPALLLVALDPTLLSQFTLVSPDVPLVCFFLLAANALLEKRKTIFALSCVLLFLTSMRGMMCVVCLLVWDLSLNFSRQPRRQLFIDLLKRSILYWPAVLIFTIFSIFHFQHKGWIGYHQNSPWADCFARVDFSGFIFNIGMYGWRLIDFGRLGIWVVFAVLLLRYGTQLFRTTPIRTLMIFTLALLVLLPANMLWAKNLLAHRYLLPVYMIFALFVAALLFSSTVGSKTRWTLAGIWFVVLLSGNFWIYPPKISKGWDSTLAHLPYYELRQNAISYLDAHEIPLDNVQSFFPNLRSRDLQELNGQASQFRAYNGKHQLVFYSNIFNIDDATYNDMMSRYQILKRFENHGVYIWIMQKTP